MEEQRRFIPWEVVEGQNLRLVLPRAVRIKESQIYSGQTRTLLTYTIFTLLKKCMKLDGKSICQNLLQTLKVILIEDI